MEKEPLVFVEGIQFYKPNDNAPKSIKGNMVIDMNKLMAWVASKEIQGQVRIDLRKSETKGTYYFTQNTWKPKPKVEPDTTAIDPITGVDLADRSDIPF
jgi:hypothetical protein